MVAHAGVREQLPADEQMALVDRAAVLREGRAGDGELGAQRRQQRIGDRPDIAGIGGIEGRAIFEEVLPRAGLLESLECRQRLRHRLGRRTFATPTGNSKR